MFQKLFCGFVVLIAVVTVRSVHYQSRNTLKCLSHKKSKFKPGFLTVYRLNT